MRNFKLATLVLCTVLGVFTALTSCDNHEVCEMDHEFNIDEIVMFEGKEVRVEDFHQSVAKHPKYPCDFKYLIRDDYKTRWIWEQNLSKKK